MWPGELMARIKAWQDRSLYLASRKKLFLFFGAMRGTLPVSHGPPEHMALRAQRKDIWFS
jgi:hypothetical protein